MFWRVFIDWNNNGSFADAGETYFNTTPFLYAFTSPNNTLNSSIAVPAGAVLDTDLRMRIKYNYVGTTNPTSLPAFMTDPCADLGNGQAEDYTIVVKDPVTVPPCTTMWAPKVFTSLTFITFWIAFFITEYQSPAEISPTL